MAKSSKKSTKIDVITPTAKTVKTSEKAERVIEAPAVQAKPEKLEEKTRHFDWRYLVAGVAAIGVLTAAVVINIQNDVAEEDRITSGLNIDNGGSKVNWDTLPTYEITLSEALTITESGTYHLTGSLEGGAITINADNKNVRLILDNVTIKNSTGPAIACLAADEFNVELIGENYLEDGASYASTWDEDAKGALYSKDDLTMRGYGTLTVKANHEDAIVTKDDLKIESGTYVITSVDDGIRGTDSVYIVAGTFNITAGGDAIKSTKEDDATKGFILIEGGDFTLTAKAKGIKAVNSLLIYGGTYNITATDDGLHSDNYINITGGDLTIASGDDGIHADNYLTIDGGAINITKSYEGLEGGVITINGGDVKVVASDDGLNANGGLGETESATIRARNGGMMDADASAIFYMNGGTLYINASGDGIDSNGYIYFNGGTVTVDGPTSNGDGALDSGISIVQNGGTVIAVGSSGMAETLGSTSTVYNASIYFSSALSAGTEVKIKNSAGETIIRHTSAKSFNHMAVGTPDFANGETYTVYVNGSEYATFTISSATTSVGNSGMNYQNGANPGQGQQPGQQPGQRR